MARRKRKPAPFDPAVFEDPVALQTRWDAATDTAPRDKQGHRVLKDAPSGRADADRLVFRNAASGAWATGRRLLEGVFLGVILFVVINHERGQFLSVVYGIGLVYWTFQQFQTHLHYVFDKVEGVYWRGQEEPRQDTEVRPLEDIYAVQLICTDTYSIRGSLRSDYQLNLVSADGAREVVTTWGGTTDVIRELRAHARALAEFLERPLWDATNERRLVTLQSRLARRRGRRRGPR